MRGSASRRWPCARARSARTARRRPSPASRRRTSGCGAPTHVCDAVRDCWVKPLQPSCDHVSGAARRADRRAGDGRRRPADGRRRGLRRDVHLQPGERRPEHGRDQRELGPRAGRWSAARSRRTTSCVSKVTARGRPRARAREGGRVRARTADGRGPFGGRSPRSAGSVACLDAAAAGGAGRGRPARGAPLRLGAGRRVGDRERRRAARRACSSSRRGRSRPARDRTREAGSLPRRCRS